MPGLGSTSTDSAVTPQRKTTITFDVDEQVAVNPVYDQEYKPGDIKPQSVTNIVYVESVGWQLRKTTDDTPDVHEQGAGDTSVWTTLPSGWESKPQFTTTSDIPGVTFGGSSANGDNLYYKLLAAGDSVNSSSYALTSDQSSFPTASSSIGSENTPMLRVALGSGAPTGTYSDHIRFTIPGSRLEAPDNAWTYYFPGPVGVDCTDGYFAIIFHGGGRCTLVGYSAGVAKVLRNAWFCDPAGVVGRSHHCSLDVNFFNQGTNAGVLVFRFTSVNNTRGAQPSQNALSVYASDGTADDSQLAFRFKYTIKAANVRAMGTAPRRLDCRGDVMGGHQVSQTCYLTSGSMTTGCWYLPFLPVSGGPNFNIFVYGDVPSGCSLTGTVYDASTGSSIGTITANTVTSLAPTSSQQYYIVLSFAGTGATTPTLQGYWINRDSYIVINSPGSFAIQATPTDGKLRTSTATAITINQQDADPTSNSAELTGFDLTNSMPRLTERGEFPMTIKVQDGANTATVFRGYLQSPEATWSYATPLTTGLGYGKYLAEYQMNATGMYHRLAERLTDNRIDLLNSGEYDPVTGAPLPFKVTDVIKRCLAYAGFASSSLDIPDLPIRIFPVDTNDGLMFEPQTQIVDIIQRLCQDYLGGYIYGDPSSGTYGTWRLFYEPDTTILAEFVSGNPSDPTKLPQNINSYGFDDSIPIYPIYKRGRWHTKRPEGNYVITYGAFEGDGGSYAGLIAQSVYNYDSFDFANSGTPPSADNNPDYLSRPVPIYQYLPAYIGSGSLSDPGSAINFVTYRVYDVACHGRQLMEFDAPLVIIQDASTLAYRPLRFYDEVKVDGIECICTGVKLHWDKDVFQKATYTVMRLDNYNATKPYMPVSPQAALRKGLQKSSAAVLTESSLFPRLFNLEKKLFAQYSWIKGLPVTYLPPFQNSDGTFPFSLGYSSI